MSVTMHMILHYFNSWIAPWGQATEESPAMEYNLLAAIGWVKGTHMHPEYIS